MGLSESKAAVEKGDNEGNHHQSEQVHQLKVFPVTSVILFPQVEQIMKTHKVGVDSPVL